MKKYKLSILVLILTMISIQACQDKFLELEPRTNKLEGNAYITEDDAFLALVSVYDVISHQEVNNFLYFRDDVFSDDTYTAGEPPSGGMVEQWGSMELSTIDAESSTANIEWKRCYRGIYRANQYIEKEAGVEWKSQAKRERMLAEVRFLRAYYYYDLVRQFGWVPLVTGLLTAEEARALKQSEPAEIYEYIAKELLEVIAVLPETVSPGEYGRATKAAAQVLMARIYLHYEGFCKREMGFTADWSDGTTIINKAIVRAAMDEIISKGHYILLPNYADVHAWDNENNAESIFEIQYSEKSLYGGWDEGHSTDKVNGNTTCQLTGPRNPGGDTLVASGWSFGTLTWSLVNEFEPGDTRKAVTVYDGEKSLFHIDKTTGDTIRGWANGVYTPGFMNTGYFNKKYLGLAAYRSTEGEGAHNYPKNYIDMRYPEVLLIAAELYLDDDNAKATGYLNQVRTRAMGESAALPSITLDDIYHERRMEFACEGRRYWDLLRRGLDFAKEKIDASYIPDASYPTPGDFLGYHFDKGHMGMLPIPADEIRNSNQGVSEQKIAFYK